MAFSSSPPLHDMHDPLHAPGSQCTCTPSTAPGARAAAPLCASMLATLCSLSCPANAAVHGPATASAPPADPRTVPSNTSQPGCTDGACARHLPGARAWLLHSCHANLQVRAASTCAGSVVASAALQHAISQVQPRRPTHSQASCAGADGANARRQPARCAVRAACGQKRGAAARLRPCTCAMRVALGAANSGCGAAAHQRQLAAWHACAWRDAATHGSSASPGYTCEKTVPAPTRSKQVAHYAQRVWPAWHATALQRDATCDNAMHESATQ